VAAGYSGIAFGGFLNGRAHHFMRDRIGKEDQQVGTADLLFKISGHFGEYFGFASVLLADLFILAFHPFVSTNDDNTHGRTSIVFDLFTE